MKSLPESMTKPPLNGGTIENQATAAQQQRSILAALLGILRIDLALALTIPALFGAVCAWWQTGQSLGISFAFLIASVFVTALGYLALATYYDFRQSQTHDARPASDLPDTPFAYLNDGILQPGLLANVGWLLVMIGVFCVFWLALLSGWPVIFFSALGVLLLVAALVPPVRYAYRGWGIGELGVAISFGILPLLGSYYVVSQSLSWVPVLSGLPLALFILLMLVAQNLATWRRDWLIGKRTLVVILGRSRALDFGVILTVSAYIVVLLATVVARMPLPYLVSLATSPLVMGVFGEIKRDNVTPEDGYRLRNAAAKAAIWTGILASAALFVGRIGQ